MRRGMHCKAIERHLFGGETKQGQEIQHCKSLCFSGLLFTYSLQQTRIPSNVDCTINFYVSISLDKVLACRIAGFLSISNSGMLIICTSALLHSCWLLLSKTLQLVTLFWVFTFRTMLYPPCAVLHISFGVGENIFLLANSNSCRDNFIATENCSRWWEAIDGMKDTLFNAEGLLCFIESLYSWWKVILWGKELY